MENNDILNGPIPGFSGGIRKTYEESIIKVAYVNEIKNALALDDENSEFYLNVKENSIVIVNNKSSYVVGKDNTFITKDEVLYSGDFIRVIPLAIAPFLEDYCLVEFIDPVVLREHLINDQNSGVSLERKL